MNKKDIRRASKIMATGENGNNHRKKMYTVSMQENKSTAYSERKIKAK
jgi:hypothetical protein